jgi:hypothetical protein
LGGLEARGDFPRIVRHRVLVDAETRVILAMRAGRPAEKSLPAYRAEQQRLRELTQGAEEGCAERHSWAVRHTARLNSCPPGVSFEPASAWF